MAAGSIVIDLLMRTGSFETDTKRAQKRLQELRKEAEKVGSAIGLAFAGVATAGALMVKASIDAADHMSDLAQQTGLTVESLSALTYAADFGGVSQDALTSSIVRLTKGMSDAVQGTGEADEAFKALGITLKNSDGSLRDADDVLLQIADRFEGFRDGAEKTALAVAIFGKSGADLIPLLNQGAKGIQDLKKEASDLGVVLSTDVANAAGDFNDNIARLQAVGAGLANRVAAELLPALKSLSDEFLDTAKSSQSLETAARAAATGVKLLTTIGAVIVGVFDTLGTSIGGVSAMLVQLFSGNFKAAFDIAKNTTFDFVENISDTVGSVSTIWNAEADKVAAQADGNAKKLAAPILQGKDLAADAAKKMYEGVEKQIAGINRSIETFGKSDKEIKLFDLQAAGATPEQLERANALLDTLTEMNRQQEISEERARDRGQAEKDLAAMYEETRTPLERYNEELIRLSDLRDKGLDWETYARGVEKAQKAFDDASLSVDNFTKHAAENIQDAIGDGLVDILDGNFKDIGDNFLKMLNRMAAEAIAADVSRKLFGNLVQGGQGSGIAGDLLSNIGNLFGFGGARAGGGDVMPGSAYLVGENGPEMFVPRTVGKVLTNEQTMGSAAGGAGGNASINVTVINNAAVDVQTKPSADGGGLDVIISAIENRLGENIAYGTGSISSALRGRYGLKPRV